MGRVIRHKQDFGAILLCDTRFTYPDALQQLPCWMRPYVKVYNEFGLVQRDLIHFFRTADKMVRVYYESMLHNTNNIPNLLKIGSPTPIQNQLTLDGLCFFFPPFFSSRLCLIRFSLMFYFSSVVCFISLLFVRIVGWVIYSGQLSVINNYPISVNQATFAMNSSFYAYSRWTSPR